MAELNTKKNVTEETFHGSTYEVSSAQRSIPSTESSRVESSPKTTDHPLKSQFVGEGNIEEDFDKSVSDLTSVSSKRELFSVSEIKKLNRAITRRISSKDEADLFDEHNALVEKKFRDGLSQKEERRLIYVRWQLDRIDDAKHGEYLDILESMVAEREHFAQQIGYLLNQFKGRGEKIKSGEKRAAKK